ncbi:MAG TPA: TrmH family RNA methyltransferase, partial [Usitatibacter sp.]|nr:TrmH family RNA methyltransferase [Usitatibacter sp.]
MDPPPAHARIRVVLARPSHPGNVGAAARAMKTMGFADLRLVAPRRP